MRRLLNRSYKTSVWNQASADRATRRSSLTGYSSQRCTLVPLTVVKS